MRKILFFLLGVLSITFSQAQTFCNKQASKISYTGKAPFSIDGQINDWESILGPVGSYPASNGGTMSFAPPQTSAFNWVYDNRTITQQEDPDMPPPESDLRFLAFTHDDYNVYYYFRREAVSSTPVTFYYFIDVNGDATMNNGEPVIYATITNNTVSALTLGRYVVNTAEAYDAAKQGNYLQDRGDLNGVNTHPMTGTVVKVFSADDIISSEKPKKNEVFAAAVTEGGYGVELSIPWSYLRNWIVEKQKDKANDNNEVKYAKTKPLNAGDIYFYHVSTQAGDGAYNAALVEDNAGSCAGGPGISGNVSLSKTSTATKVGPFEYRFNLSYTNLTNAATEVDIQKVVLKFKKTSDAPIDENDFVVTILGDLNCNGVQDGTETITSFDDADVQYDAAKDSFTVTMRINSFDGALLVLPPHGTACFIASVTVPSNGSVSGFKIAFATAVFFVEGKEPCEPSCGGKPINQVGFVEEEVGAEGPVFKVQRDRITEEKRVLSGIVLYPNPSKGVTNLALPLMADVTVEDGLGRTIQRISRANAGLLQLKNLKPGFYIIKVKTIGAGNTVTKKLTVQ